MEVLTWLIQAGQSCFGEQPSSSKWNILGTNDASFNNGTGIANIALSTTSVSNPYKFSVYRNAAFTTTGSAKKIEFDTELFDTNNNFDSTTNYRYTAPVTGYYQVNGQSCINVAANTVQTSYIYKNGSAYMQGSSGAGSAVQDASVSISTVMLLTAGDYIEFYVNAGNTYSATVSNKACAFSGYLISQT